MKLACYPIVRPLLQLAHSRRFIVALLSGAFIVASIKYPELTPITNQILTLSVSVIFGMTVEDTAGKLKLRSPAPQVEAVTVNAVNLTGGRAGQGLTPDLIAQIAKEPAIVKALTTAVTAAIMQSPAPKDAA